MPLLELPVAVAALSEMVLLETVRRSGGDPWPKNTPDAVPTSMPPPKEDAVLPETVLLLSVRVPSSWMPPPLPVAVFPEMVLSATVRLPEFTIPPPLVLPAALPPVMVSPEIVALAPLRTSSTRSGVAVLKPLASILVDPAPAPWMVSAPWLAMSRSPLALPFSPEPARVSAYVPAGTVIASGPVVAFAAEIASRREQSVAAHAPSFVSAVLVTVNESACAADANTSMSTMAAASASSPRRALPARPTGDPRTGIHGACVLSQPDEEDFPDGSRLEGPAAARHYTP